MALFLPLSLLFPLRASRSLVPLFSCTARVNDSAFSSLHLNILIELNRFSRRVSTIMEYHCRRTSTRLVVRYNRIILPSIMCTCQSKVYDNQMFKFKSVEILRIQRDEFMNISCLLRRYNVFMRQDHQKIQDTN